MPLWDLNKSKIGVAAGAGWAGLVDSGQGGEKAKKRCWERNGFAAVVVVVVDAASAAATWEKNSLCLGARGRFQANSAGPAGTRQLLPHPLRPPFPRQRRAAARPAGLLIGGWRRSPRPVVASVSVVWWWTKNQVMPGKKIPRVRGEPQPRLFWSATIISSFSRPCLIPNEAPYSEFEDQRLATSASSPPTTENSGNRSRTSRSGPSGGGRNLVPSSVGECRSIAHRTKPCLWLDLYSSTALGCCRRPPRFVSSSSKSPYCVLACITTDL